MEQKRGIITIGTGAQKYIDMAVYLAMSCRLHSPGIPLAVVTDSTDPVLKKYFDIIIPANPAFPKGIAHKVYVADYSPFDETVFIDGDCLVVRDISMFFDWFRDANVTAIGQQKFEGTFFGLDFETLRELSGHPWIGAINGGIYYFKKNERAKQVFDKARELLARYSEIGFAKLRGGYNEEGLMAVAMATYGELPYDDKGAGMRTPMGQSGQFRMDVLKGYCSFIKHGTLVRPAVMHFGGDCTRTFFYRREVSKLKLAEKGIPKGLAGFLVNCAYNSTYSVFVFGYRIAKALSGKAKFRLKPVLPMYRFE